MRRAAEISRPPRAGRGSPIRCRARLSSLADNPPQAEDADEELRAELRRRVQRFVEADFDIQRWEKEREEYDAAVALAMREGGPMPPPLRMHPAGPQHREEAYLTAILKGREAT